MTATTQQATIASPTDNAAATLRPAVTKPTAAARPKANSRPKASNAPLSKQDRVLAMLRRKEGATVAAVVKAMGWQAHSVRGFFAGVVRKKLKLNLISLDVNGKRTYRIASSKSAKPVPSKRKRSH